LVRRKRRAAGGSNFERGQRTIAKSAGGIQTKARRGIAREKSKPQNLTLCAINFRAACHLVKWILRSNHHVQIARTIL
jgi:hypothetical protein